MEQTRLPFHLIKTDSYLAIQAVSKNGKVSNMSNVVHIQLPDELILKFTHASQINQLDISSNDIPTKNMTQKSDKILFYVLFAVIAIVLLCILAVLIILKRYQNVKSDDDKFLEDPIDDLSVIGKKCALNKYDQFMLLLNTSARLSITQIKITFCAFPF